MTNRLTIPSEPSSPYWPEAYTVRYADHDHGHAAYDAQQVDTGMSGKYAYQIENYHVTATDGWTAEHIAADLKRRGIAARFTA